MELKIVKKSMFNVGDVMEIALSIETHIPDEDFEKCEVLHDEDYKHSYSIYYTLKNDCIGGTDFTLDEGCYPSFGDDIVECVKEEMEETFPEITDYDIFDIDNEGEYKTAKIRVKEIKE